MSSVWQETSAVTVQEATALLPSKHKSSGRLYSPTIDCSESHGWNAFVGRQQWQTHKSMGGCQLLIVTVLQNGCCFNILYRFLCNTLTCARQPRARINSAQRIPSSSPFVKSQSCFNDAWRNIQALTFHCQVSLEKSIKIIQLWPSYPVNAY